MTSTSYNIITIGYDCSPASVLRNLGLREHALPFDWVVSSPESLNLCFKERFTRFHCELKYNQNRSRLVDAYGFQFPHDYPHIHIADGTPCQFTEVGEGVIGEEAGQCITPEWPKYYDDVKAKYERRIARFNAIMADSKPLLVLCRWPFIIVKLLKMLFATYFNKSNVYFVNSTNESNHPDYPHIYNCYTEANGTWNDAEIWKLGIDVMAARITAKS
jgi:hypothetical protein